MHTYVLITVCFFILAFFIAIAKSTNKTISLKEIVNYHYQIYIDKLHIYNKVANSLNDILRLNSNYDVSYFHSIQDLKKTIWYYIPNIKNYTIVNRLLNQLEYAENNVYLSRIQCYTAISRYNIHVKSFPNSILSWTKSIAVDWQKMNVQKNNEQQCLSFVND